MISRINRPAFVFFLLASTTLARTTNDPPISSPVGTTEAKIKDEEFKETKTTEEVDDSNCDKHVKIVSIEEGNLTNVFKNGVIENNIVYRNQPARSDSESVKNSTGNEKKYVRIPTVDGDSDSQILSRTFDPYRKNSDNVSKILLYPVNGTTIVYRETTFRPIMPNGMVKTAGENGSNGYLPLSTWSRVNPEVMGSKSPNDDEEEPQSRDADVIEAANFGLEAMNDLYYIKEPKLFSMGQYAVVI